MLSNNLLKMIAAILLFGTWIGLAWWNLPQMQEVIVYIKLALEALGVLHVASNIPATPASKDIIVTEKDV